MALTDRAGRPDPRTHLAQGPLISLLQKELGARAVATHVIELLGVNKPCPWQCGPQPMN